MKLQLDANSRKFLPIEIELEGTTHTFKYYEKNTKQIKAMKALTKDADNKIHHYEELNKDQFMENFKGEQASVDALVEFYEENGNFYEFINMCDRELGKLKQKG